MKITIKKQDYTYASVESLEEFMRIASDTYHPELNTYEVVDYFKEVFQNELKGNYGEDFLSIQDIIDSAKEIGIPAKDVLDTYDRYKVTFQGRNPFMNINQVKRPPAAPEDDFTNYTEETEQEEIAPETKKRRNATARKQ